MYFFLDKTFFPEKMHSQVVYEYISTFFHCRSFTNVTIATTDKISGGLHGNH